MDVSKDSPINNSELMQEDGEKEKTANLNEITPQ